MKKKLIFLFVSVYTISCFAQSTTDIKKGLQGKWRCFQDTLAVIIFRNDSLYNEYQDTVDTDKTCLFTIADTNCTLCQYGGYKPKYLLKETELNTGDSEIFFIFLSTDELTLIWPEGRVYNYERVHQLNISH